MPPSTEFNPLTKVEITEVLHGVRNGANWHLSSATTSKLWDMTLTDRWEHLQDAPYYKEFFKYLKPILSDQPHNLIELHARIEYTYGAVPERDVAKWMNDWRDDWEEDKLTEFMGQSVRISQRSTDPDQTVSIILMTPLGYDIIPLDD